MLLPWSKLARGQGFFVPTLDVEQDRMKLLFDAQRHGVPCRTYAGVLNGMLGVLCVRA